MQNRFRTKLQDGDSMATITDIHMIRLQCSSATMNSLLDHSVQLIDPDQGLLSLTLTSLGENIQLDESVLERVSHRSHNL